MNKVALITGSTRGIGRCIIEKFAKNGYNVVVTGKTLVETDKTPGTIYSVSEDIEEKYGVRALAGQLDLRNESHIYGVVNKTAQIFGRIDVLINNAGALWWDTVLNTPYDKFDLINDVNVRGSYLMARECIPHMLKNDEGEHIIMHSPPLPEPTDTSIYKGKAGYMVSKLGMTMVAMGMAEELKDSNINVNTIWPQTPVKSYALMNFGLGEEKFWRKPDIIADSVYSICQEDADFTANQLIDEHYLMTKGETDFTKYRCDPEFEPPTLNTMFDNIRHRDFQMSASV
jgi:citronellol/citronellal dehydrogenase